MKTKAQELYRKLDKLITDESTQSILAELIEEVDSLECDLRNMTEEKDILFDEKEELEKQLEDCEEAINLFNDLKELSSSYHLSDSQYHQDMILMKLQDELNLKLIVAPAKNQ